MNLRIHSIIRGRDSFVIDNDFISSEGKYIKSSTYNLIYQCFDIVRFYSSLLNVFLSNTSVYLPERYKNQQKIRPIIIKPL